MDADRLMGVLEADLSRDDVFGMEMPCHDVGDAVRHFGAGIDPLIIGPRHGGSYTLNPRVTGGDILIN